MDSTDELMALFREARMTRDDVPACYVPPHDYECGQRIPSDPIDPKALADLRACLSAALCRYEVDEHSLITCSGKFEREHIACPIYWDSALSGASEQTWSHDGLGCWEWLTVDSTDCAMWPDLAMRPGDVIELHESDSGFVSLTIIPMADLAARERELDKLCGHGLADDCE